jgi:hypothetical protein
MNVERGWNCAHELVPLAEDMVPEVKMWQQAAKSEKEYLAHDEKAWRQDYFNPDNGGYLATSRRV